MAVLGLEKESLLGEEEQTSFSWALDLWGHVGGAETLLSWVKGDACMYSLEGRSKQTPSSLPLSNCVN